MPVARSVITRSPSLRRAVPRSYSTQADSAGVSVCIIETLTPRAAYPGPPTSNVPVVGSATASASCSDALFIRPLPPMAPYEILSMYAEPLSTRLPSLRLTVSC